MDNQRITVERLVNHAAATCLRLDFCGACGESQMVEGPPWEPMDAHQALVKTLAELVCSLPTAETLFKNMINVFGRRLDFALTQEHLNFRELFEAEVAEAELVELVQLWVIHNSGLVCPLIALRVPNYNQLVAERKQSHRNIRRAYEYIA